MATTTSKRKASSTAKKKSGAKKATKSTKTTKRASSAKASSKSTSKKVVKTVKAPESKKETKAAKTSLTQKKGGKFDRLNLWNWAMAALHTVQGAAVLILSRSDSLFPVRTSYITQDTLASSEGAPVLVEAQRSLFDVNLAYLVAAFFFLSALAHLYIATVGRKKYESQLDSGMNKARWYEYSLSASVMMVAIAMLSGVSDLSTLLMIFGATAVMNLCGLVMEVHNQTTKKTNWISYIVGTIAGIGPWAVVGLYLWGANQYGSGDVPTFVYFIFGSIFIFFSSFAVNMILQYRGKGRWSDYLYGEKAYMVLSLVAKSALAWQIFAGTLRP